MTALAIAGPRLYAGGGFTKIDGVGRPGLAAFDLKTRRLTSWAPKLTPRDQYSLVQAMAADGNTIYIGGVFARANGEPRRHLAAFDATTGALLPWNPQLIGGAVKELGDIKAIDVADGRVYVAYEFTNTNEPRASASSVSRATISRSPRLWTSSSSRASSSTSSAWSAASPRCRSPRSPPAARHRCDAARASARGG